jgi:hypothetical protein
VRLVCVVCERPVIVTMCQQCQEAYDRANRRDSTTLGLIRWAAMRARKCERARKKGTP